MGKLAGKTAVVTGGNAGVGLAIARLFVAEGAFVFISGRREKELKEALDLLGPNAAGIPGDVSKLADLDRLFDAVRLRGNLDIVVANAGIGELAALGEIAEAQFTRVFDTNVKGTLFTVQKALPLLNEGAAIVVIGSVAGVKGTPGFGIYGASKAALRSFVRGWSVELKHRRVRSNVLSPGPVDTAILADPSAGARRHREHHTNGTHGGAGGDREGGAVPRLGRFVVRHGRRALCRRWPGAGVTAAGPCPTERGGVSPASQWFVLQRSLS